MCEDNLHKVYKRFNIIFITVCKKLEMFYAK